MSSRGEDDRYPDDVQHVARGTLTGSMLTIADLHAEDQEGEPVQVGGLVRRYRGSRRIDAIDTLIAATAFTEDVPIVILNAKHFNFIPGLLVLNSVAE